MNKETLKLALEALETELSIDWTNNDEFNASAEKMYEAITAIKEALAKQEQGEPVAWMQSDEVHISLWKDDYHTIPLYTTPQQRTWVGLDPEEIRKTNHHMVDGAYHYSFKQGAEWAEAKLKEINT
jgi:hypothetical protein